MKSNNTQNMIDGISVLDFARYLNFKGFRRNANFANKNVVLFDKVYGVASGSINIIIPSKETFADYYLRLEESIRLLSEIENKPVVDIIEAIMKPNVDKLQIRVISDIATEGSIPLSYASNFVANLRDLMVSAACAEENPEPYYNRALKSAIKYADSVRFGQTQKGSFIATIESYVPLKATNYLPNKIDEKVDEEQIPFQRRVMQRIQYGIAQLETAIMDGNIDEEGYKTGLTANMCESLLKLKSDSSDMKFEYIMNWSPVLPAPKNIPDRVLIERNGFELLETISRKFRGEIESAKKKIIGYIIGLSADELDEDNEEGSKRVATVRLSEENDNVKKVKIQLTLNDYRIACDAHKDSKPIAVDGILERDGKQWRLTKAQNFCILARDIEIKK